MLRLIWFSLKLLIVIIAAIFVAEHGGNVSLEWDNAVVETSVLVLVGGILALIVGVMTVTRAVDTIAMWPRMLRMRHLLRQQRAGQDLLAASMDAASLAKNRHAVSLLAKAEKLLGRTAMVDLVRSHTETPAIAGPALDFASPYAWRAAIEQRMNAGNMLEARQLAERFAEKHASLPLPKKLLFDIYIRLAEFDKALSALDHMRAGAVMGRQQIRHARAALFAERARRGLIGGHRGEAFEWAMQADRLRAGWVPAIIQAVHALEAQSRSREAASLIERVWSGGAHRQLADDFLNLKTGKSDIQKAQIAERMAKKAPDHPATLYLMVKAYVKAGLWGQARNYADKLIDIAPSSKAYSLMALIEEQTSRTPSAVQRWNSLAAGSSPAEAWICHECKTPHAEWQAVCTSCGAFDALHWERPLYIAA